MLEAAGSGPVASYGLLFRMAENRRQRYALFLRVRDVAAVALARGAEQARDADTRARADNAALQDLAAGIDAGWRDGAAQTQAWTRQGRGG